MPLVTLRLNGRAGIAPLVGMERGSRWQAEIYMGAEGARALKAAVDAGAEPLFEVVSVGYVPDEKPPRGSVDDDTDDIPGV